jgi:hypothetical protein
MCSVRCLHFSLDSNGFRFSIYNRCVTIGSVVYTICNKKLITKAAILNFVTVLKDESWSDVSSCRDVKRSFNSFINSS